MTKQTTATVQIEGASVETASPATPSSTMTEPRIAVRRNPMRRYTLPEKVAATGHPIVRAPSARPATIGLSPGRDREERGHELGEPYEHRADSESDEVRRHEEPAAQYPGGHDRLGRAPLDEGETTSRAAPPPRTRMLVGEFHAHACPPCRMPRISSVRRAVKSTAPR